MLSRLNGKWIWFYLVFFGQILVFNSICLSKTAKISDGKPLRFEDLGISLTPPVGWEVLTEAFGKTLILQFPKPEKITNFDKPIFQRNITVAVAHESAPIDAKQAEMLKKELVETIGQQAGIADFQVANEHKFFDYKGKNDGLIVYSFMKANSFPMMQIHIMVSGEKNRVLLSYTDLEEDFEKNLPEAWTSMTSVEVIGPAPWRYQNYLPYVIGSAVILMLALGFVIMRRFRARSLLKLAEGEDSTTLAETPLKNERKKNALDLESEMPQETQESIALDSEDDDWQWISGHDDAVEMR